MAHISTNPPWEDFPSRATLITALSLENIEKAIDAGGAFMKLTDEKVADLETAPPAHAGTHAAGGSDPVTPESIKAVPAQPGYYAGHLDDAPSGTVRTSTANPSGAPVSGAGFVTTAQPITEGTAHAVQTLVYASDNSVWVRTAQGQPRVWGEWTRNDAGAITLESIGAFPASYGIYGGHADDAPEGTAYLSSSQLSTGGWPWLPDAVAWVTTLTGTGSGDGAYRVQRVTGQSGTEWNRTKRGPAGWSAWNPVSVDTGWRDISDQLTNGWTGTLLVRRVNFDIDLRYESPNGTAATDNWWASLPDGFTPTYKVVGPGKPRNMYFATGGKRQIGRFMGTNSEWTGNMADIASAYFTTADPIPQTLPGTPV